MGNDFRLAIAGDCIINRRVSICHEESLLALTRVIQSADVGYAHLETLIHDYDGPELYPAAESGWAWMRSPLYVADELRWLGFDMVSTACNHSLDYSYGGLASTWQALRKAGIVYAGTGRNLGEARAPAYLETAGARVALVSMSSTFPAWARAGESRAAIPGRPGLNPLRFHYVADQQTLQSMQELAIKLGWWVRQVGREWHFHPAGLHHAIVRVVEGDQSGITTVADEQDAEGNLRSIREARRRADYVLVHLHSHEWNPNIGLSAPDAFVTEFAHACVDSGADIFVGGGSHAPLRGIEIYKGKPILYDPGDLIVMTETVTELPADSYLSPGFGSHLSDTSTPADAFSARRDLPPAVNPLGGYHTGRVNGAVVAVCSLSTDRRLAGLTLHPVRLTGGQPSQSGLPMLADGDLAREIIAYVGELSAPLGTSIRYDAGVGTVELPIPPDNPETR